MDKGSKDWKEAARQSYGEFLDAVEGELPENASIVDIERAMLKHYQKMMSDTTQALADHQDFPPSDDKRET